MRSVVWLRRDNGTITWGENKCLEPPADCGAGINRPNTGIRQQKLSTECIWTSCPTRNPIISSVLIVLRAVELVIGGPCFQAPNGPQVFFVTKYHSAGS